MNEKKIISMGSELTSLKDLYNDLWRVDYTAPNNSKYIIIDTNELTRLFPLLNSIVSIGCLNKYDRGITIITIDEHKSKIVYIGYKYFETIIKSENNLKIEDIIYIDFLFIKKLKESLPDKILIYLKNGKKGTNYYIRTTKGDIKINYYSNISINELKRPKQMYNSITIIENKEYYKMKKAYEFISLLSQVSRPSIRISDGVARCSTYFIGIEFKTAMPNMTLYKKDLLGIINYLNLVEKSNNTKIKYSKNQDYTSISLECDKSFLNIRMKDYKCHSNFFDGYLLKLCSFKITSELKKYIHFLANLTIAKPYLKIEINDEFVISSELNKEKTNKTFKNIIIEKSEKLFSFNINIAILNKLLNIIDEIAIASIYNNVLILEDKDVKIKVYYKGDETKS